MKKSNLRRVTMLVTCQTAGNLEKLAKMAGYGDQIGRVVDKLTRDRMLELRIERVGYHRNDIFKEENSMEQYIGTKIIEAEPAYRVDGKTVQPTTWPVEAGSAAEEGYAVRYQDGRMTWTPKEVFKREYEPMHGMNFGLAIEAMRKGFKVRRRGWNGKNQHIELASAISYTNQEGIVVNAEHEAIGNQAVAFCGTSGVQMGRLASQADMLADDWEVV